MKLEGSLDAFSLPDIFALLSMTKKTGGLHLRRAHAHGVVWFTTGAITGGASDVTRQALARRVVGSGGVDLDAVQDAVASAGSNDGTGVVRALMLAGALDEAVLHELVAEQVVDAVFDLLRWPDGEFAFGVEEANPDDVGVSCPVDDVVTEARRRLEAWTGVAAAVPSPQTVLSLQTALDTDPQLSRDEWSLLALVDGRRSVAHIVGLAGRGEFAVVSALAALVGRGLLRVDDDSVSVLLRAQELLTGLEATATPADGARPDQPVVEVVDFTTDDSDSDADDNDDRDDEDEDDDVGPAVAAVTQLAAVPARPEPFLPRREPDHPESMPVAAAGGSAVPAPATATMIERDPSVNKSLLLRLIAGVRGL